MSEVVLHGVHLLDPLPAKKISTPAAFPLRLCRFRTLVFVSSCFIFLALLFSFAQQSCISLMSASRDACVCLKEVGGVLAGQKSMLCEATCQLAWCFFASRQPLS